MDFSGDFDWLLLVLTSLSLGPRWLMLLIMTSLVGLDRFYWATSLCFYAKSLLLYLNFFILTKGGGPVGMAN